MARHPDELICDFAETYHIYDMRALEPDLAAVLALGLGERSRTQLALSGAKVDPVMVLLTRILDGVAWLQWSKTEAATHGKGRPEPLTPLLFGQRPDKDDLMKFDSGASFEATRKMLLERIERHA